MTFNPYGRPGSLGREHIETKPFRFALRLGDHGKAVLRRRSWKSKYDTVRKLLDEETRAEEVFDLVVKYGPKVLDKLLGLDPTMTTRIFLLPYLAHLMVLRELVGTTSRGVLLDGRLKKLRELYGEIGAAAKEVTARFGPCGDAWHEMERLAPEYALCAAMRRSAEGSGGLQQIVDRAKVIRETINGLFDELLTHYTALRTMERALAQQLDMFNREAAEFERTRFFNGISSFSWLRAQAARRELERESIDGPYTQRSRGVVRKIEEVIGRWYATLDRLIVD